MVGGAGVRAGPGGLCVCVRRALPPASPLPASPLPPQPRRPRGRWGRGAELPGRVLLVRRYGAGKGNWPRWGGGSGGRWGRAGWPCGGGHGGAAKVSPTFPDRVQELTPAGCWRIVRPPSKGAWSRVLGPCLSRPVGSAAGLESAQRDAGGAKLWRCLSRASPARTQTRNGDGQRRSAVPLLSFDLRAARRRKEQAPD